MHKTRTSLPCYHQSRARLTWLAPFTLCFALWLALPLPSRAAEPPDVSVTAIQAHLFLSGTGQLSADVLGDSSPSLVNVVAGDDASISTLVTLKLTLANPKRTPARAQVSLVATEQTKRGPRAMLNQTSRVGPFSKDGVSYVGFWLPNTGCASIALRATVTYAQQNVRSPALTSVIPFSCNE
jgi:hypothetical protein